MRIFLPFLLVCSPPLLLADDGSTGSHWHQASGPNGNYQVSGDAPTSWSVSRNENVLWRTSLPESGQSCTIVWGDKLFTTTNVPWPADSTKPPMGKDAVGFCLDAHSGEILWHVPLPGSRPMKYAGIFSDSTSPSPVTDGKHVWFFNASGYMGCWSVDGEKVWTRAWQPRSKHHSRQFEPILHGNTLLFVEVLNKKGADVGMHKPLPPGVDPKQYWLYLHAYEKSTGLLQWVADAGTAVHNTPTIGQLPSGEWAILHGRGGGHAPPEKPYGFGLTSLTGETPGKTLWTYKIEKGTSYYTSPWNEDICCWFDGSHHLVVNTASGELIAKQPISEGVSRCFFDRERRRYRREHDVSLKVNRRPNQTPTTNMANLLVGEHHYFMTHETHHLGRIHVGTGNAEYLEVPLQVVRNPGKPDEQIWDKIIPNDTRNSRGVDVGIVDKRSKKSGWGHVSAAPPICVGDKIYITTMVGMTYVINRKAETFDENALLSINDLGPAGQTWSLTQPVFANGRIYTRTMKEVICLGTAEPATGD